MANLIDIKVPDIGDFKDVKIVEVAVKPGDQVAVEDPLITLESDKASIDVPAPQAGIIRELKVKVGDRVSEGSEILLLEPTGAAAEAQPPAPQPPAPPQPAPAVATSAPQPAPATAMPAPAAPQPAPIQAAVAQTAPALTLVRGEGEPVHKPHASPAVRQFARQLGVDLSLVKGSGLQGRIFREDVQRFVKEQMSRPAGAGAGLELLPWPQVDFAKFGEIEIKPLPRIRVISKANLHRNWVMIPHVTQFDEADVTELEALRKEINQGTAKEGIRVTMLAFIMKALVPALIKFPEFNSSLEGDNLVLKKYFHLGFAADTPNGLLVPVIRDVDKKGVVQIARETAELAAAAREGKLKPTDMQGGCFSVSSLGGIGGTAFTPIINAPEVAILGVSRLAEKPVYRNGALEPRLMLPLSLSYDHRVIDGAAAARFTTFLAAILADMRRALL
jgi:pyruvate dehydrogenase E2 component (dihydrolipoamide acetyltransferase)